MEKKSVITKLFGKPLSSFYQKFTQKITLTEKEEIIMGDDNTV